MTSARVPMSQAELLHAARLARRIEPSETLPQGCLDDLVAMFEEAARRAPIRTGRRRAILDLLEQGPLRSRELAEQLGGSYRSTATALEALRKKGLVECFKAIDPLTGRRVSLNRRTSP